MMEFQRPTTRTWRLAPLWLALIMLSTVAGGSSAPAQTATTDPLVAQRRNDDAELVEGLRRRRLFDLAEFYCQQELENANIDPTHQGSLVIELMKTQTARAMLSPTAARTEAWKRVDSTATEFLQNHPAQPRSFLIEVQVALSHIAHGNLLRQEIAADMAPPTAAEQALEEIRSARTLLSDLQRRITRTIPEQHSRTLNEHELTGIQLLNLNNNIRFQLALCNLSRAQLYDPGDRLNRIDALNGVQQRLAEVQREATPGQPLWWNTKIAQIECLRLLRQPEKALSLEESLPTEEVPPHIRQGLLEQKIRLALDVGDPNRAQAVLAEAEKLTSRGPALDLARVELAADLSTRALTEPERQDWLNFASIAAQAIDQTHGSYWGRRADLILIEAAGGLANVAPTVKDPTPSPDPPSTDPQPGITDTGLAQLIRLADDAARKDRVDDAIKAYDLAAHKARSLDDLDQGLRMDIRVSQMFEKKQAHQEAATRLIEAAIAHPELDLAAAAHLRGCWNFAQTLAQNPTDGPREFQKQLEQHLSLWPQSPTANQSHVWLGGQLQLKKQWREASQQFLQVTNDSPQLQTAIEQTIGCVENLLYEKAGLAESTRSLAATLIAELDQKRETLPAEDPIAMQLLLARVRFDLIFGTRLPVPELANQIQPIEASQNNLLSQTAKALHAVSVSIASPATARLLVEQLDERSALEVCERCLAAVSDRSEPAVTAVLELRLSVIDQALNLISSGGDETTNGDETNWLLRKSQTLTGLERHADAILVLQELEAKFPRNAGIKMQLARALTAQYRATDPEKPLTKWRQIASRLKSHSPNWYEAKYHVALLLVEAGKKNEAAKILKYIQAIPPGWDQSEFKSKFEALLKRAE